MNLIAVHAIGISPNRQRREFDQDAQMDLVHSLEKHGLFHPLVLRIEGESYVLVSGERRLRAIQDLWDLGGTLKFNNQVVGEGLVPYVYLGDLDPLDAEEAELEENVRRVDLTWQERAHATARLAALRTAQAQLAGGVSPTTADIALEVRGSSEGTNQEATRQEIIVAAHLDDPEVSAAGSVKDAFTILRRRDERGRNAALAADVGRTFTAAWHTALNCDSIEWMREQKEGQFDVILTDPPYGIGADEFGDAGGRTTGSHFYGDSYEEWVVLSRALPAQLFRMAKEQAHVYCFCDIDRFHELRDTFRMSGWWTHRTPLVWYKPSAPRAPWPLHGPQRKYELILYAVKGERPTMKLNPDVITLDTDINLGHPAQKPVGLYEDLLKRSVRPGDSVFDPFMGTGTIFEAAHGLKCKATGIELDAASYGIALRRLNILKESA